MSDSISNTEDMIDSRDVIERLAELAGMWAAHQNDPEEPEPDDSELEELRTLTALVEEAEGYSDDWQYGATLIHESYFTEYAKELAEDIGAIDSDAHWPSTYIDWEAAAGALKMDYAAVDFDGQTYYVR